MSKWGFEVRCVDVWRLAVSASSLKPRGVVLTLGVEGWVSLEDGDLGLLLVFEAFGVSLLLGGM